MLASALLALYLLRPASAADAALLAPTPDDLIAGIAALERHLADADALAEAVGRPQNAWVSGGAVGRKACANPGDLALAAQEAAIGAAWRDEARAAVAIAAVGGGCLCPLDQPADGRVVVVPDGLACYGDGGCGCAPVAVLPGEVLGPVPR